MSEQNPIEPPKKQYVVQRRGFEQGDVLTEEQFNAGKDQFFNDFKQDAIAYEMAPVSPDYEIGDNDTFIVKRKGFQQGDVVTADQLRKGREQFLKDFPDAEITRVTPVNYFGDQLRELYDKQDAIKQELGRLPKEEIVEPGADPRAIQGNSIAQMQDIVRKKRENPSVARSVELNRELNEINRLIEENPAMQQYRESERKSVEEGLARVGELKKEYDETMKAGSSIDRGAAQMDSEYLKTAKQFYDDAQKIANAPSRYGDESAMANFWQGIKDTGWSAISVVDLVKNLNNVNLIESAQRIQEEEGKDANIRDLVLNHPEKLNMSHAELEMWKAFIKKGEMESSRQDDLSRAYQAGQGAAKSLGFMADFYMTGGIGGKAADKLVGGLVEKAGRRELAKLGAETLYGITKAAVMTPLMPSSYSNFINNIAQFNDSYGIDLSGKALRKAAGDVLIENVSETVGSKPMELITKPLSKVAFPAWAKALRNSPMAGALKQAGYNGFLEEMVEEWTGNALRVMTGVDKDALRDFATIDQQLITMASFAPMAVLGLSTSTAQYAKASKAMRSGKENVENIINSLNVSDDVKEAINKSFASAQEAETPEDFAHQMTDVTKQIVDNGGNAEDAYKAAMEYTRDASRYKVMTDVFDEQKDIDRSRKLMEMDAQMQNTPWHHYGENGSSYVRTVTDQQGNERFVVAQDNGELALVDHEGKPSFMTEADLTTGVEDGTLTDSGEVSLFSYLDNQVEADQKQEEQVRMQDEARAAQVQLQQMAQPGVTVNVGTIENPVNAVILGFQAGSYIVQKEDGTTEPHTPEEIANFLGIRLTPETDAEIEAKEVAQEEKNDDLRKAANQFRGVAIPLPDGSKARLAGVTRSGSEEKPFTVFVTDETGHSRSVQMDDAELEATISGLQAEQPSAEAKAEVEIAENQPVEVDDGIPRDFRGNPLPLRTNSVTGEQEVDSNTLWNEDPEAWVKWNDSNPNPDVTSDEKLDYAINQLSQQVAETDAAIKQAALGGTDQTLVDTMKAGRQETQSRLSQLEGIKANRVAAAETAAAAAESAASVQQTPMAKESAPAQGQQPAAPSAQQNGETPAVGAENAEVKQSVSAPATADEIINETQKELDRIDKRLAEERDPANRYLLMEERAFILEDMLQKLGAEKFVVAQQANLLSLMKAAGASKNELKDAQDALDYCREKGLTLEGFYCWGADTIFMVADGLSTAKRANRVNIHESKHMENRYDKANWEALATGVTREEMISVMRNYKNNEAYDKKPDDYLSDEVIAVAAEIAEDEGVEAIPQRLRELGARNEKFINFVQNNIKDGRQRDGQRKHYAARPLYEHANPQVDSGYDAESGRGQSGDMEGSGIRPSETGDGRGGEAGESQRAAEPGLAEEPAPQSAEEDKETREITANIGGRIEEEGGNAPTLFSITAGAEGAGLKASKSDDSGNVVFVSSDGRVFDGHHPITAEDIKNEPNTVMGYMMADALKYGTITPQQADTIWQKYADTLNRMLEKGLAENGGFDNLSSQWQWVGETVFKTIHDNSDAQYKHSIDITRVCKKNEAVIKAISALQRRLGYGITPGQIMDIYRSSIEEGYQVPCPVCYVFSRYIGNGYLATVMINGQKKYGDRLVDPATLTEQEKKVKIAEWVKLLEKIDANNNKHEATISQAKEDIKTILKEIDGLSRKALNSSTPENERKQLLKQIKALDKRYKAALNVVSQSNLSKWIKNFAVGGLTKPKGSDHYDTSKAYLYDDTFQGFPAEYALDIRLTADAIRKYPGIQRMRKSLGSSGGKAIQFAANNDIGDVLMLLGHAERDKAPNYYKLAAEAKTQEERNELLKKASAQFKTAMIYAQQQSLRGGQRMWSWSDNIERLAPDVFFNLMQMEMLGGALQSYSKQLEGIKLVASMGGYVNGSLMGKGIGYQEVTDDQIEVVDGREVLKQDITDTVTEYNGDGAQERTRTLAQAGSPVFDDNGKRVVLVFDDIVGIDPYGKNGKNGLFYLNATLDKAGNILVGMDDTHVRAAMADDRVFFIIPWHASGLSSHILAQMMEYLGVNMDTKPQDYTDVQEEKDPAGGKVSHKLAAFWEAHKNETDFKCAFVNGIPSGKDGKLSQEQRDYRTLRDAIFDGRVEGDQKMMDAVMRDEFLSQVYRKVQERVITKEMTAGDKKYVYPYEYWDETSTYETADVNGARYLEYCRRLGIQPKFVGLLREESANKKGKVKPDYGNFADDKGYWKLLIDRRMYKVDGTFQDLDPVSTDNYTPNLVDPDVTEEEFNVTTVADDAGVERIADRTMALEENRPGGIAQVNYDTNLDKAVKDYLNFSISGEENAPQLTDAQKFALEFINGANENEENKALFDAAKTFFGTTRDLREAGYILPDGTMLDFSGRHLLDPNSDDGFLRGRRTTDHREIESLAYEKDGNTPTGIETDMPDFIRRGAVRIDNNAGSINLAVKPTADQQYLIRRIVENKNGNVWVDFGDGWDTEASATYEGAKPARVINDIKRYFDEGIEPADSIRFSIRGILGAKNDSSSTRALMFLQDAEAMEKAGKDPLTIWLATGWERGKDGKWRNEIPDGTPKEIPASKRIVQVKDVIDAPELFASYPAIADYPVIIKKLPGRTAGTYRKSRKDILLNSSYAFSAASPGAKQLNPNGLRTMMHEVQHAIQDIEGFARGGNSDEEAQDILEKEYKVNPELVSFARMYSANPKNSAAKLIRVGSQRIVDQLNNMLTSGGFPNPESQRRVKEVIDYLSNIGVAEYPKFVRKASKLWKESQLNGMSAYRRLAGEVEARNVQTRMNMPEDEREVMSLSETEDIRREDQGIRYSIVTDPLKIAELEAGEKMTGYRTVNLNPDGSFGSPKASRLGKKGEKSRKTSSFELNAWEEAEENPDLATEDGKINLADLQGVDYNPYIHIRPDAINKQFTTAWRNPQQVYIQTSYPASELTSGYHADKAKLSVGRHHWTNGDLILSRWDKPERIMPWEEVADAWEQEFKDTGVTFDIVNPGLLPILAERGVEILPPKKSAGAPAMKAYENWKKNESPRFSITAEQDKEYMDAVSAGDMEKAQRMVDEAAKEAGYSIKAFHGSYKNGFTVFNDHYKWSESPIGTYWFSANETIAKTYQQDGGALIPAYLKMDNPLEIDAEGMSWDQLPAYYEVYIDNDGEEIDEQFETYAEALDFANKNGGSEKNVVAQGDGADTNEYARRAKNKGYDGLIVRNVSDLYDGLEVENDNDISDDFAVFSPSQIKSADPVTYDDSGNVIPLSERFNPGNEDIRFSISNKNEATYRGKPFWIGSVNLTDGEIEEVHSYEEAEANGFHHTFYFSDPQLDKIDEDENGIFWVENGKVQGDWYTPVPIDIRKRIEEQIRFRDDIRFSVAYHGSGAEFDRFDLSHALEGEGAMAHGYGHYVALTPGTATKYAKVIGHAVVDYVGPEPPTYYGGELAGTIRQYMQMGATFSEAKEDILKALRGYAEDGSNVAREIEYIEGLNESDFKRTEAHRYQYTLEIPDDTGDNYIDEMKTLKKDGRRRIAEIVRAIPDDRLNRKEHGPNWLPDGVNTLANVIENRPFAGKEIRQRLVDAFGSEKFASDVMHDAGFVGMKYNGRSDGPCAVIFDDNDIQIVDRVRFSVSNANQRIFVSNAERAVESIRQEKATPEQWLKMIEKNGGLKAGEDKWLGLSEWLKSQDKKSLTKQEVLDFIGENQIKIEETHYSGELPDVDMTAVHPDWEAAFHPEFDEFRNRVYWEVDDPVIAQEIYETVTGETIELDEYDELPDNAMDILSNFAQEQWQKELDKQHPIDQTRLRYTTDGLENYHEIALTVPTIEPWNQADKIHFGDAGEGRAVAWIRFGDAFTGKEKFDKGLADKADEARVAMDEYTSELMKKYGASRLGQLDAVISKEERDKMRLLQKNYNQASWRAGESREVSDEKKVLFIDEIQSKRHQEGREKGYRPEPGEISAKMDEILEKEKKVNDAITAIGQSRNIEEAMARNAEYKKLDEQLDIARAEYRELRRRGDSPAIAPFEKNWHELAMKRMLRYAAENGYDVVAWTTGDQQAERYSLGGLFDLADAMEWQEDGTRPIAFQPKNMDNDMLSFYINREGIVVSAEDRTWEGKPLSDVCGKELAKKLLEADGEQSFELDDLRIGGEGMRGFYDQILPRFMNKYGKQWGVKVSDENVNLFNGSQLLAHTVPVTQEMKDSVMEGQLMFSVQEAEENADSPVEMDHSIVGKRDSADEVAKKCGIIVEYKPSSEMQFKGKPLTGRWVNGKMYVCLEHCRDENDAMRTVLHAGVGHNGLRRLIGNENMRQFCLDVYKALPEDARREITENAVNRYGLNIAEAVEEYLADKAETMDYDNEEYEHSFWDVIRNEIRKVLAKIGINVPLSERDTRWLMWQSYNANNQGDLLNEAKRQVVANRLGFTLRQQADVNAARQSDRMRFVDQDLAPASRLYNKDVMNWMNRLHETWVDKDDSVLRLVEALEKATGKKAAAFEDVRLALNQQSSKGLAAIEKFEREHYNPMMDAIKDLMRKKEVDLHAVERYVMLKHGLERNDVFAKRDAREYYRNLRDKAIDKIRGDKDMSMTDKEALVAKEEAKYQRRLKNIDAGTDLKYKELRKQDYGGLTAMYSEYDPIEPFQPNVESQEEYNARVLAARHPKFTFTDEEGVEHVDMQATEAAAQEEVAQFENGFDKEIDTLWKKINGATKATLKHQYDSNMISRQQYQQVKDMFQYYVPLRGFADTTAEDLYDYYQSDQRNVFTPPLQKAKGRTTESESPFGYIGAMASSGIAADMKNETKLALYYFVSNRANNDLVTVSDVWYEKVGETDDGKAIFEPVYPPFNEDLNSEEAKKAYEDWENTMKEKAKAGIAYKGTKKLDLHNSVIHIDDRQKASHVIKFKVGGEDKMMFINGNPRAAQAINNELNVEMSTDYQKVFGKVLRWFSGINTSYNPEFWLSNAQRDILFALMAVNVKEDKAYNNAFHKNFARMIRSTLTPGAKGGAYSLKKKFDNGELGDAKLDNYYKEFAENGGVTGYTVLKNNEEWEQELRKYTGEEKKVLKGIKDAFQKVQNYGEAIEQMSRFAAYITSRDMGKDIKDSVNDAKELTVNFNRKGSGKAISFKEAEKLRTKKGEKLNMAQRAFVVGASWLPVYGRRFIMFFNASVQGLNAMYKLVKADPGRLATWVAGYFALGVTQALIHAMLDDDDDYLDIPDYERRNNLLVGGNGAYFKWALPQEARVFYAIGDMSVNHLLGREPHKNMLGEVLSAAADIAPLNPAGGVSALAPSAITPIIEVILNQDYKGSKIYNDLKYLSDEERKRTPAYQKAYTGTGKFYVEMSKFANWLSGGDYADAGWININPAAVEHILKGATGGAGTTLGKLFRGTVGQAMYALPDYMSIAGYQLNQLGDEFMVRNTPFLSRLLTVTDERYRNAHTTELFDYYKAEAEHTKKRIKTYQKEGDDKRLDKILNSKDYDIMNIYESYKKTLEWYGDELKATTNKKDRKDLMREQDSVRKDMIMEISNIDK